MINGFRFTKKTLDSLLQNL